jgi:hypothetical protein
MRREWTDAEVEELRRDYPFEGPAALARRFGRSIASVKKAAWRYRANRRRFRATPAALAAFPQLKARGDTDREIAEVIGATLYTVLRLRRKLGLCHAKSSPRQRARQRDRTRSQCVREGVDSLAGLRELSHRVGAARRGWPPDVPVAGVRILELLAAGDRLMRAELARRLGVCQVRASQLGDLEARGLIQIERRASRRGGHLYSLATFADDEVAPKRLRRAAPAEREAP